MATSVDYTTKQKRVILALYIQHNVNKGYGFDELLLRQSSYFNFEAINNINEQLDALLAADELNGTNTYQEYEL